MIDGPGEVTRLLAAIRSGQAQADELIPLVYRELRQLAASYLRRERPGHTLQPTALVHEAYIKLAGQSADYQNRSHFFGIAAQTMRRILIDHYREHDAGKRGGGLPKLTLDDALQGTPADEDAADVLDLDRALTRLAQIDPRQAQMLELRFFGGLSVDETAEVLGVARRTVLRDWRVAQAWLRRELGRTDDAGAVGTG